MKTRIAGLWLLLPLMGGLLLAPCDCSYASPTVVSYTFSSSTITFPGASPATGSVAASENPITVTAQLSGASNAMLTVIASGDLTSGGSTIPISSVTWTSPSPGFSGGTLSKTSQVTVAAGPTGTTGPVTFSGTLNFRFANLWTYATGSYAQTITFTITAF